MATPDTSVPCERAHIVELYGDDDLLLVTNVTAYMLDGANRGDGLLVVATPERNAQIVASLTKSGFDTLRAISDRQLVLLDANETLASFMTAGQPDWNLFEAAITSALRRIRARRRTSHTGIRIYGEMVGVLWQNGDTSAAIRLEHFWNKLQAAISFDLFCGYAIHACAADLARPEVQSVLAAHTHHIPATSARAVTPVAVMSAAS
jgi:hypothetical protein